MNDLNQLVDKTSEGIHHADKEDEFVKEIDLILYEDKPEDFHRL